MRYKILFLATLFACAPAVTTRPVVLPAVQLDASQAGAGSAPSQQPVTRNTPADSVFRTDRDDPFHSTNRTDWPGPNRYRSSNGSPGPDYWQQRADYTIVATLDTAAKSVAGNVMLKYTNNSPDTLRYIWMQVDQNLYRSHSKGSLVFPADSRWGVRGFEGGYDLTEVKVNGSSVAPKIDDTMMRLDLPAPLKPHGGTITVSMGFHFLVPEHGSDRMGRDSALYEIAQWYPRMAVYDDVRGWNTDPYLGQGEFYLEYGDIDYTVTAPAGFVVAGSGVLQNSAQVLSSEIRARLDRAAKTTDVVRIVTADEAKPVVTAGTKSWHFIARNVRDVAWAAAPDFRWDATSWNGVLCQAFYEFPKAGKAWEAAAEQTQWTIRHYSETFFPFPYPRATSVAGPVGGMEYPMFVMVEYGGTDPSSIFDVLNHEHGHEWFPMTVGSNERRYAWMDEGFNTYLNAFAAEARFPGRNIYAEYLANWQGVVRFRRQTPLMTAPDLIDPSALGAIGYRKPAIVLLTLRNHVVGPQLFDAAFREYIRQWAFKHPTPGDFFRAIENGAGADLSWFWRGFFYSTDVLDIGIDSVAQRTVDGGPVVQVSLHRMTSIVFPVSLRVGYSDGTTEDFRLPVEIWGNNTHFDAVFSVRGTVTGVRLWPDHTVPDWNPANDTWGTPPPADPLRPVTRGSQ